MKFGIQAGVDAGCRFCLATRTKRPKPGTLIRVLNDSRAGQVGKVVDSPEEFSSRPNVLFVEIEGDESNEPQMVDTEHDLIEPCPGPPIRSWALPLPLREAEFLHGLVLKFCTKSVNQHNEWETDWPSFREIIWWTWNKRLPVEPNELWNLLRVHGAPTAWRIRLRTLFRDGRDLLLNFFGKKPLKKLRVPDGADYGLQRVLPFRSRKRSR